MSYARYSNLFISLPHSGHLQVVAAVLKIKLPFLSSPKSKTSSSSCSNSWRLSHIPRQDWQYSRSMWLRFVGTRSLSQFGHFMVVTVHFVVQSQSSIHPANSAADGQ